MNADEFVRAFLQSDFLEILICDKLRNSIEVTETLIREYESRPYNKFELEEIARWKQELLHLRAVLLYYTGAYQ
jgi:hypothetical protein